MEPSKTGGGSVPAWIAERVAEHERDWPLWVLAASGALSSLGMILAGGALWTANALVCYARP